MLRAHEMRGDIADYIWYTRDFILKSSITPQIYSLVEFCPWCGKYLASYSLADEYVEAYEKEKEKDPTLLDIMDNLKLVEFQDKFLMDWESQNQTLDTTRTMQYNQERLKFFSRTQKTIVSSYQEPQP